MKQNNKILSISWSFLAYAMYYFKSIYLIYGEMSYYTSITKLTEY